MLPDFPKLKSEILALMNTALKASAAPHAPMVALTSERKRHEGEQGTLKRADGTSQDTAAQEFSGSVEFHFAEFGRMPLAAAYDRYMQAATDMERHKERFMIKQIIYITKQTGNVLDVGDAPFNPDQLPDALEMTKVSFDEDGQPEWPTFVAGTKLYERMQAMGNPLEEEPYRSRMAAITEKKRAEWYARESRRRLVG